MSEKTLFNYYSLDECIDKKLVMNELKSLKADGKIEYSVDHGDILKIVDIDLEAIYQNYLMRMIYFLILIMRMKMIVKTITAMTGIIMMMDTNDKRLRKI